MAVDEAVALALSAALEALAEAALAAEAAASAVAEAALVEAARPEGFKLGKGSKNKDFGPFLLSVWLFSITFWRCSKRIALY